MSEELPTDVPEWMQAAMRTLVSSSRTLPSASSFVDKPEWPMLLEAAVVQSFLPRQLRTEFPSEEARAAAEKVLLKYAETIHDPGGTKWSLTQQARRDVLNAALQAGAGTVRAAIERTTSLFRDDVSAALRQCLVSTTTAPPLPNDLPSLEAMRSARGLLTDVDGVSQAGLDELDKEIELRRLLAPFERMIGETVDADGNRTDRFFGRVEENDMLRNYVGEVSASTWMRRAIGLGVATARVVSGVKPLSVWGIGGVGKTTLIAKFMLDHARAAESRFPFAYLDFDRPTISARNLTALFLEICSQVASQFPAIAGRLDAVRSRVEEIGRRASNGSEALKTLLPSLRDFRGTLDAHFESLDSTIGFRRAFLIVFDTFEVAQYDPESLNDLADFVSGFTPPDDSSLWPRLRVVLSGRQQVTEFGGPVDELPIDALDRPGSISMLLDLAQGAAKPIGHKDAERLIKEIVRAVGSDRKKGVDPLRLRLIGATFRDTDEKSGASHVASLISELREPISVSGISGRAWVDGLLVRRVLNHVRDRRVKALSDPGLVVRYITKDVIRDVMTVATPDPARTSEDVGDSENFEPWRVTDEEADSILKAFAKEVSLVTPLGKDALQHRQDVRRQMLPLIRSRRPHRFERVNRLAFEFFRAAVERAPEDRTAAAEAIYHGLMLGVASKREGFEQLDWLWRGPGFEPRIDIEEFAGDKDAARFLRAKTGQKLSADDVGHLPVTNQRDYLRSWLPSFLKDTVGERSLELIRKIAGDDFAGLQREPRAAAVVARLLYRSGRWEESRQLAWRFLRGEGDLPDTHFNVALAPEEEALVSLARTWSTITTRSSLDPWVTATVARSMASRHGMARTQDGIGRVQLLSYSAVSAFMDKKTSTPLVEDLRRDLVQVAVNVSPAEWQKDWRVLRLAVMCGGIGAHRIVETFARFSTSFPREREALKVIADFIDAVYVGDPERNLGRIHGLIRDARGGSTRAFDDLDDLLVRERARFSKLVYDQPHIVLAVQNVATYEHSDWENVLGNALNRALKSDQGLTNEIRRTLLRAELLPDDVEGRNRTSFGRGVVRFAASNARFLELARRLADIKWAPTPESQAPQDVIALARAMLSWHETLREFVNSVDRDGETQARAR
jgi:hypothetical protein